MTEENIDWPTQVLRFWFEELSKEDWFKASTALDESIISRFSSTHERLASVQDLPSEASPEWALAAVIVLDQFSRNMFRGTKDAFASDLKALRFAKQAMERKLHQAFNDDQKHFLYMPFMHSENKEDHNLSVKLFTELGREKHAIEHAQIIEKFGCYPHRNEVLGRESTKDELQYLIDAKRFGQ